MELDEYLIKLTEMTREELVEECIDLYKKCKESEDFFKLEEEERKRTKIREETKNHYLTRH